MATLTAAYDTHSKDGELIAYPVAANTTIFKGALVALVAGFLVPASDTAGAAFVGVAHETKFNTAATTLPGGAGPAGAAGALKVRVHKVGSLLYNKAAAVAAAVLGVSRQRVLQLIAAGELEAVKIGKDWFVGTLSLQERLARHPAVQHRAYSRLSTRPSSAPCL